MKYFLAITLSYFFLTAEPLFAQVLPSSVNPQPANKPFNFDQNYTLSSQDGTPFPGDISDADGTPYFFNEFRLAIITLANHKSYDSSLVRLDLLNHECQYMTKDKRPIILKDGLTLEILFPKSYDQMSTNEKFRAGYPPIDINTTKNFYQVLSDGRLQLLKLTKKDFRQTKDPMSGEIKKEFVQNEFYYVYSKNNFRRLKKDKDKILELMQDKEKQIDSWLDENKISFRNVDDLIKLFDYYNNL